MGGKKICITVSEEVHQQLEERAKVHGFMGVPGYIKCEVLCLLNAETKANTAVVNVKIENYREVAEYVAAKRLGSVAHLATFAMEQYMTRYPLSEAQKAKSGKLVE